METAQFGHHNCAGKARGRTVALLRQMLSNDVRGRSQREQHQNKTLLLFLIYEQKKVISGEKNEMALLLTTLALAALQSPSPLTFRQAPSAELQISVANVSSLGLCSLHGLHNRRQWFLPYMARPQPAGWPCRARDEVAIYAQLQRDVHVIDKVLTGCRADAHPWRFVIATSGQPGNKDTLGRNCGQIAATIASFVAMAEQRLINGLAVGIFAGPMQGARCVLRGEALSPHKDTSSGCWSM